MSDYTDQDRAAMRAKTVQRFLERYSVGKDAVLASVPRVPQLTPLAAAIRVQFQIMDRIRRGRAYAGHKTNRQ